MPQVDIPSILFITAGLGLAVSFAILAGILSARVFFHATGDVEDEQP